jgi:peptidoglycan/LPS O-acetylase OafA/YrhL
VNDLSEKKPLHFVQLDALRFMAAFMVVVSHAWEGWEGWFGIHWRLQGASDTGHNWLGDRLKMITHNMNFGVDMFFLISGFLITFLLIKEKSDKGKINIPAFFLRRALRIWPLYYFVIAISPLIISWLNGPAFPVKDPEYLSSIFFYNNFHTMIKETWDFPFSHFWSICIEEHFYLIWPFLLAFIPVKKLPFVFVSVIALSIGFRIYISANGLGWHVAYLHTLSRIDVLAIGGLAAWAHYHKPYSLNLPVYMRLLLYAVLLWMFAYIDIGEWPNAFELVFKKYVFVLLSGLAMMNYVFSPNCLFKWLPKHPVNYLGRACFGIYLWGNILLPIVITKLLWLFPNGGKAMLYWPCVLGASLLVPVISYELIERPFLKLKARFAIVKTRV